jgi:HD superfamily phosphohydrolase
VGAVFEDIAPWLIKPDRINGVTSRDFNDPVWKIVSLRGVETGIADMRLMQRLRRVRQLGLADLVYFGAHHSRFEHSIGALHAAGLMFDRLAEASRIPVQTASPLRQVVRLAALLHDCGHVVFSHVGERVLGNVFRAEFDAIAAAFDVSFPDPLAREQIDRPRRKIPPAAEILSALLTVSPAMEQALTAYAIPYSSQTTLLMVCGLILGRPYYLVVDREYYHFVKGIVSGDLDADKIDYVARDAFYAGVPTATDVDRLLLQLVSVPLTKDSRLAGASIPLPVFKQDLADRYHLLGIKPSGASALEMFVMTRSYLHERIYGHPKTRAAESLLERLLRQVVMHLRHNVKWNDSRILRFLLNPSGDDGTLARICDGLPGDDGTLAGVAERIVDRKLPVRALAISQRTMAEFEGAEMRPKTSFLLPWNVAESELSVAPYDFESAVCAMASLRPGHDILVDWPHANPVKERPDIWVRDPLDSDGPLYRVNHFFDVEQLSNAYRDVKQVGWIFTWPEHQAIVAASAGAQIARRFDLVPGAEAFRRAKVTQESLEYAKQQLLAVLSPGPDSDAVAALCVMTGQTIRPPPAIFIGLPFLSEQERETVGHRLSVGIGGAHVDRAYYDDLFVAVEVLKILLRHCIAFNRHQHFRRDVAPKTEARFQSHLLDFCNADERCGRLFTVNESARKSGGITDLMFVSKGSNARTVVVELKSAVEELASLYDKHAGQPLQYAEAGLARFSILYCQYASNAALSPADTLEVRRNTMEGSAMAVFCLGQKAFWEVPSDLGKISS